MPCLFWFLKGRGEIGYLPSGRCARRRPNPPTESKHGGTTMKMVKSLLLVSAAGLVAVSGAQAADLPVKAKPVEYVKVCSLYGAGFYYIPGTDICMKVGGYIRYQVTANPGNSISGGPLNGTGGRMTVSDVFRPRPCRLPAGKRTAATRRCAPSDVWRRSLRARRADRPADRRRSSCRFR